MVSSVTDVTNDLVWPNSFTLCVLMFSSENHCLVFWNWQVIHDLVFTISALCCFQGSERIFIRIFARRVFSANIWHYTLSSCLCQHLFSNYFWSDVFRSMSFSLRFFSEQWILYSFESSLSTPFFKLFLTGDVRSISCPLRFFQRTAFNILP